MALVRKLQCQVIDIISHPEGVYTLLLKPKSSLPRFKPGQFLHLAIDPYDPSGFWPDSRPFSIASSPSNRDLIRLSYSVVGGFTKRIEQELHPGKNVWIKLPYGDFFIDQTRDAVIFAGGTGITVFISFVEGIGVNYPNKINLFYGARTRELLIYREIIEKAASISNQFTAAYFIEEGKPLDSSEIPGRMNIDLAMQRINRSGEEIFYLSGPPDMLQSLREDLLDAGINKDDIRIDAWT